VVTDWDSSVGERRYDSGHFMYKVHTDCGVGQGLWRAGREGDPLVSRLRVCGVTHPLASTGKPSWWCFHSLKSSGHYMHHQFNIHKLYVLPTQCIDVFCVDLRTNSDYFPIQH
jgi:hypothetical protein